MDAAEMIRLSDAPPISGLRFRRLRGAADYPAMAAVHEGARVWDRVDPLSARESVPGAEDMAAMFPEAETRDSPDLLLAEVDGCVVGYNHVLWRWNEVTGLRVYLHLGYLLPDWRGKGIGTALLHWAQERIRAIAAAERHPGPTTFATNVSSTEREADLLMRHDGYVAVRRMSDMVLEPLCLASLPPLPDGVTLRPFEPAHGRALYQTWKDAFAGVSTSTAESEDDYQQFVADYLHEPGFDPALCKVAWADDQLVGFVLARIGRGVGTIAEVAVHRAWQRRGIARGLMLAALNAVHERGCTQARLFTDADDGQGARSLYERLGFREVKQHIFYRKPLHE